MPNGIYSHKYKKAPAFRKCPGVRTYPQKVYGFLRLPLGKRFKRFSDNFFQFSYFLVSLNLSCVRVHPCVTVPCPCPSSRLFWELRPTVLRWRTRTKERCVSIRTRSEFCVGWMNRGTVWHGGLQKQTKCTYYIYMYIVLYVQCTSKSLENKDVALTRIV